MPELKTFTVKATTVRKGDFITISNKSGWIADIKVGDKWTVVRDADGKLLCRVENDTQLDIEREVMTDEEAAAKELELEAGRIKMQDEMLEAVVVKMEGKLKAANDKMVNAMQVGYQAEAIASIAEDMVQGQYFLELAIELRNIKEHQPEMSWFEIFTHVVDREKEKLVEGVDSPTWSGGITFKNAALQSKADVRRTFIKSLTWYHI